MLTEMFIELSRIKLWATSSPLPDYGDSDYSEITKQKEATKIITPAKKHKGLSIEDEEWYKQQANKEKDNETVYYPCDKKSELYVLQQEFILHNRGYRLDVPTNDSR